MEKNNNADYLTGAFRDRASAERAYHRLRERGYTDDEINIIMSDETRTRHFMQESDYEKGLAGAGALGITGGIVGALVGAGIPKERAIKYEKGIKEGDIVMGVRPRNDNDASYIEDDWSRYEDREK